MMVILKNIEQIADKFNCLVKDGSTGLVDVQSFIDKNLADFDLKRLASSLDKLDKKQNIVEDFSEILFQLRDFLPSVNNFVRILLLSKNYESIVFFTKKIFINQIGNIRYSSVHGSYSFVERYFDKFIEIVKNCKIESPFYLPFVARIVSSVEGSVLYQWIRPAKEYMQTFFNDNEHWIDEYVRNGEEYKYEIIDALCGFNTYKGVSMLIKDFIEKQNYNVEKSSHIFKQNKKDVISAIDKDFVFADEETRNIYIQIYSLFLPDNEIVTRLKQIYEEDKFDSVKNQIASILGITDTLSIKTEKQFMYAVRRKIKEPQQRAIGVVFDKVDLKLKSGFKCDDSVFTFLVYLLKEEKNLNNIKKLNVLENIFEMEGLQSFAQKLFNEIKDKKDILFAKWAIRCCSLFSTDELATDMSNLAKKLFLEGRRKEANYLTECLIYSGREQILSAIKELNQSNPEILGELKDVYANKFASSNNKFIEDVYDELVEDVATDDSIENQTQRLFDAYICKREYTEKKFEKLFMSDNVLGQLSTRVVWGEYKFGRLYNCFIIKDKEKSYIVKTSDVEDPVIALAHTLDLDERFDDVIFALTDPLFEQFRRSVFDKEDYSKMAVSVGRFSGMFVNIIPFINSMSDFGFKVNANSEDELFNCLVFEQKEVNTLVEVAFDKFVTRDQQFATLSDIYFYRLQDVTRDGEKVNTIKTNAISVGGVADRLFDYALNAVSVSSRRNK